MTNKEMFIQLVTVDLLSSHTTIGRKATMTLAECLMIPEEVFAKKSIKHLYSMAIEYVNYNTRKFGIRPEWVRDEWFDPEW